MKYDLSCSVNLWLTVALLIGNMQSLTKEKTVICMQIKPIVHAMDVIPSNLKRIIVM